MPTSNKLLFSIRHRGLMPQDIEATIIRANLEEYVLVQEKFFLHAKKGRGNWVFPVKENREQGER